MSAEAVASGIISREIYRDNLCQLIKQKEKIVSSVSDIQQFCPHLKEEQIKNLIDRALEKNMYFAVPAVLVKNSYHVLSLESRCVGQATKVYYAFTRRTKESYADQKPHRDVFSPRKQFSKEAIEYAEAHWSDSLILDSWESYGELFLDDPTDLHKLEDGKLKEGTPRTKAVIYWTTKRTWNEIVNDHSEKLSVVWNRSLAYFSQNVLEGNELQGGRSKSIGVYCSRCGEGLSITACKVCKAAFKDTWSKPDCSSAGNLPEAFVPSLKAKGLLDQRG